METPPAHVLMFMLYLLMRCCPHFSWCWRVVRQMSAAQCDRITCLLGGITAKHQPSATCSSLVKLSRQSLWTLLLFSFTLQGSFATAPEACTPWSDVRLMCKTLKLFKQERDAVGRLDGSKMNLQRPPRHRIIRSHRAGATCKQVASHAC